MSSPCLHLCNINNKHLIISLPLKRLQTKIFTMKKILLIALLAITFATQNASANASFFIGTTEISIQTSEHKKGFKLQMENIGAHVKSIDILNGQSQLLKSVEIKKQTNFNRNFNLQDLEEGEYQLVFHNLTQKVILPFSICKAQVLIKEELMFIHYVPIFNFKNNKLDLNANNNAQKPMEFKIFDESNEELLAEEFNQIMVNKRYDLSKLPRGTYRTFTQIGNETYSHFFEKE